jgi:dipeptidyl aminopeptidase/acylaminoacyl peptidase
VSVQHIRERIRIAFDVESHEAQTDEITGSQPQMWRNNDVQFELGFFFAGEPVDASQYSQIKLLVKDKDHRQGSIPLILKVASAIDITTPVFTKAEWEARSKQHVVITVSAMETRLDLGNANEKEFFLSVIALTSDGNRITLGSTLLKLHHDGEDESSNSPPLGSSLIPQGAVYNGSGIYTLTGLVAGRRYALTLGDNDTKLVNGSQELTEAGNFTANGTSVVFHGDASSVVTATLRYPVFPTIEEADARYARAGTPWVVSPNKRFVRVVAVDDNGKRIDQVIDLQNL